MSDALKAANEIWYRNYFLGPERHFHVLEGRVTLSSVGCCDESSHWLPRCQHSEYVWRQGISCPKWTEHPAQFAASVLLGTVAHTGSRIAPKEMRKCVRRFHLNIRKHFFFFSCKGDSTATGCPERLWRLSLLLGELRGWISSLETFRSHLDVGLGTQMDWARWTQKWSPFQPQPLCDASQPTWDRSFLRYKIVPKPVSATLAKYEVVLISVCPSKPFVFSALLKSEN